MAKKKAKKSTAPGWRPSANVAGGKSYSEVAREILKKTHGNRAKATMKLKELGCTCAAQIVSKMAIALDYPAAERSEKKSVVKKKSVTKKPVPKKKTAPKKAASKKKTKSSKKKSTAKRSPKKEEEVLEEEFEEEFEESGSEEDF